MESLKYSEIISLNRKYQSEYTGEKLGISILSNITINSLTNILELHLYDQFLPSKVSIADFDNIVQESHVSKHKVHLIFWEASNLTDNLHYKINTWDDNKIHEFIEKVKNDIEVVLKNLDQSSLIIFNKFSSLAFDSNSVYNSKLHTIVRELNSFLVKFKLTNLKIVDIDKIIANLGVQNAIDLRSYHSKKTIYTIDFFKLYTKYINSYLLALTGKLKKVIVLDCDNTLWGGVLGEDGIDGIKLSETTAVGSIFLEVQHTLLNAYNSGILLCLCSKNNLNDVEEVLQSHTNMILRKNNIIISKCNWQEKYLNIKEIAKELNLGLESIVFIDDSNFELTQMKSMLPEVTCIKVPENLYEYAALINQSLSMYFNFELTVEDRNRNSLYKQNIERDVLKQKFQTIEDYLVSLQIEVEVNINDLLNTARISQLTQKTNQFNLNTKRYSEKEIEEFIISNNYDVYSFTINDKFGSNGITAIVIIEFHSNYECSIDTFLMSCRIIGRNIEFVILDFIAEILKTKGILQIKATYIKSQKNIQVENFYEKANFKLVENSNNKKAYAISLEEYQYSKINYIKINKNIQNEH